MQPAFSGSIAAWVEFLGDANIPVLQHTTDSLILLKKQKAGPSARNVVRIIRGDPLMMIRFLRYLQRYKNYPLQEAMHLEQALIMFGTQDILDDMAVCPFVEAMLQAHPVALIHLRHRIQCAHIASNYAVEWAIRLHDPGFEEIRVAALLHDMAELLLWCFAPARMLKINTLQQRDNTHKPLHSHSAQRQILGFTMNELQSRLVTEWSLPELMMTLMDGAFAAQPRVQNVLLSVNLARHTAHGWDDVTLPEDFAAIGRLLHITPDNVKVLLRADTGQAVARIGNDVWRNPE